MDFETFVTLFALYQMSGSSSAKASNFRFKARQALLSQGIARLAQVQKLDPAFLHDDNPNVSVDLKDYVPTDLS